MLSEINQIEKEKKYYSHHLYVESKRKFKLIEAESRRVV